MKAFRLLMMLSCSLMTLMAVGCAGSPGVRPVYEDNWTSVRLQEDREAGSGHHHPATFSPEAIAKLLEGLHVVEQRYAVHELLAGSAPPLPAFTADDIRTLAPAISQALGLARPGELVTFYRRYAGTAVGLAYTTGGLFLHGDRIYLVLANHRQPPSDAMRQGIPAYEWDPINAPLLSLLRGKYAISFVPAEAEVHPAQNDWTWSYPDPGKVIAVNAILATRLLRHPRDESSAIHK